MTGDVGPVFQRIAGEVETYVDEDSTGHGMDHAWRVFRLGRRVAAAEGADGEVVGAAALTHDLHRVLEDGFLDPAETLPEVEAILAIADFPAGKRAAVAHCVEVHEDYGFAGDGDTAETLEAEVLRDADNLDAMGAIGIARAARFSAVYDQALWDPGEAVPETYDKTDYTNTLIGHFHEKLLRLRDEMHTATARDLAEGRHRVMAEFVEQFEKEWLGER